MVSDMRRGTMLGEKRMFSRERGKGSVVLLSLLVAPVTSASTQDKLRARQFAITGLSSRLIHATNCLAERAEQYIRFSPGFFFEKLPRGPPSSPQSDVLLREVNISSLFCLV